MVGPNLPFGGLACGLVLGPLPSHSIYIHVVPKVWAKIFLCPDVAYTFFAGDTSQSFKRFHGIRKPFEPSTIPTHSPYPLQHSTSRIAPPLNRAHRPGIRSTNVARHPCLMPLECHRRTSASEWRARGVAAHSPLRRRHTHESGLRRHLAEVYAISGIKSQKQNEKN